MVARSRELHSIALDQKGHAYTLRGDGSIAFESETARTMINSSYLSDETHPAWVDFQRSRSNGGAGRDAGGPMDHIAFKTDIPSVGTGAGQVTGAFITRRYDGPASAFFTFRVPDTMAGPMNASSIVTAIPVGIDDIYSRFAQGGTAISRCAPARPEAGLTVSIIELLNDGVPSLLSRLLVARKSLDAFRGLGKDYLNVEFGWKPFVSDIRKTLEAVVNQEKILKDLSDNSGKRLRRRYSFAPTEVTETSTDSFMPFPQLSHYEWSQTEHVNHMVAVKKTWFSGEFVYRVPQLHGTGNVGVRARHLLGLDLTPSTLWNAAPWTWLADWVGNTGDVLANISSMSADDLVMRYGYLMQEAKMEVTSVHRGVQTHGYGIMPSTIEGKATFIRQTRVPASPFGFGLNSSDFSSRQIAVLAALGISRR